MTGFTGTPEHVAAQLVAAMTEEQKDRLAAIVTAPTIPGQRRAS